MKSYRPTTKAKNLEASGSSSQLRLIAPGPWRLSEASRAIGREGLANARAALEAARRQAIDQSVAESHRPSAAA